MFTPQLQITRVMRIPSDASTKAAFQNVLFVTMTMTAEMVRMNRLNVVSVFSWNLSEWIIFIYCFYIQNEKQSHWPP